MGSAFTVKEFSAVCEIRFDDGAMNLLSTMAIDEFDDALEQLPPDNELVVFRSSRNGLFAAGADMKEMAAFTGDDARRFSRKGQRLMLRIERFPGKTVALIDGDCFGGALDLVLAFDVRIATPRARFSHPGAKIGIVTGFGGTSRWRRLLSAGSASKLFLDNEIVSAEEAREIGLVDEVLPELPDAPYHGLSSGPALKVAKLIASLQHLSPLHSTLLARRLTALYEFEV